MYWSLFRRSSAVEQLTVNQLVVGSIPTAGANKINSLADTMLSYFLLGLQVGYKTFCLLHQ